MRYAITGGAGFLGLHLARRLLADGHEVRTLDLAPLDDAALERPGGGLRGVARGAARGARAPPGVPPPPGRARGPPQPAPKGGFFAARRRRPLWRVEDR